MLGGTWSYRAAGAQGMFDRVAHGKPLNRRSIIAVIGVAITLTLSAATSPAYKTGKEVGVQQTKADASTGTVSAGSIEYTRTVIEGPNRPLNPVIEVWHEVGTDHTRIQYPSQSAKVMTTGEIVANGHLATYEQTANGIVVTNERDLSPQERAHWITGSTTQELRDQLQSGGWQRGATSQVGGQRVERVDKEMSFEITDPKNSRHLVSRRGLVVLYLSASSGLPVLEEQYDVSGQTPILRQRMRMEYRVIPRGQAPAGLFSLPKAAKEPD